MCHEGAIAVDGPDFLGPDGGDRYTSITAYTRIVTEDPADSVLPYKIDHLGDVLCTAADTPYAGCMEDEVTLAVAWLEAEAAAAAQ
jgi:hypothetical protein